MKARSPPWQAFVCPRTVPFSGKCSISLLSCVLPLWHQIATWCSGYCFVLIVGTYKDSIFHVQFRVWNDMIHLPLEKLENKTFHNQMTDLASPATAPCYSTSNVNGSVACTRVTACGHSFFILRAREGVIDPNSRSWDIVVMGITRAGSITDTLIWKQDWW